MMTPFPKPDTGGGYKGSQMYKKTHDLFHDMQDASKKVYGARKTIMELTDMAALLLFERDFKEKAKK